MDKLTEWLEKNKPNQNETAITHGDYRLDNVVFHPTEPRVIAVLDWELCTIGNPLCDAAYVCMPYYMKDMSAGTPTETDLISLYCKTRSIAYPPASWPFYVALSFFRLASIAQGVYARSLKGNASATNAGEMSSAANVVAELGLSVTMAASALKSNSVDAIQSINRSSERARDLLVSHGAIPELCTKQILIGL